MGKDKSQAQQAIDGHTLAAVRNPRKAEQHLLAAKLLRKEHGIPEPGSLPNWKQREVYRK